LQNQLDEIRYGWKRHPPILSLAKRVVRNPRFPLLPPPYESASRTRFPRVRPPGPTHPRCILRDTSLLRGSRALQIVESIVEICIANSAIHAHECGRCSSFEWELMHLQCGSPSKLLFL
jgi:hypothetical protein